jgi:prophage antirepressor-like protein
MEQNAALQVFKYKENEIRTIFVDGEIWFVAADACKVLEHSDTAKAVSRLDEDEKGTNIIRTPGGPQEMLCINEPGFYSLVLTSRKPEAKPFKRWVTHEVIPSIRKTGNYSLVSRKPEVQAQLEERLKRLERQVSELKQVRQKQLQASSEDTTVKVTKRVLVFLQRQEEPVSRRIIITYVHCTIAVIEPILDQLVASGQVSRIKVPGSRVQWFYQLSGSEDEMTTTERGREMVQRNNNE